MSTRVRNCPPPPLFAHVCAPVQALTDVESQLVELQKKYRMLEVRRLVTTGARRATQQQPPQVNRKAYSEDAQGIIRRQRAAIEKLQGENTAIKHELDVSANVLALRAAVPTPLTTSCAGRGHTKPFRAAGAPAPARDRTRVHPQGAPGQARVPACLPHSADSWRLRRSALRRWTPAYVSTTQKRSRNGAPWGVRDSLQSLS